MPGEADAHAAAPVGAGPVGGPPLGPPVGPPSGGFPPGPPSGGFPVPGPPSGGFPPGGAPSPYPGMPPAGPGSPGGENQTPLFIAIGVVVAAAVIGLIFVLSSGDDEDDPTPSTNTTEQPNPPATDPVTTEPSGGGGGGGGNEPTGSTTVEVVDSGFSNFMGGFDQDERSVTYGFIVENTGDEIATDISISISAYDADGTALASDSKTIYVLRPGEQMGLGDEFFGDTFSTEVDSIDVQVSEPSNYSVDDVPDEGTLTAEGITTTADDYSVTTKFTATSTYGQQLDYPSAYAIYRNTAGDIIGGSSGSLDFVAANGSTAGEVSSWDLIPDVATTEVYLDPGGFY
jgi:hypothetical protein